jgi:hypothetical protein
VNVCVVLKMETNGINKGHAGNVFSTEVISSIRFPTLCVTNLSRISRNVLFPAWDFRLQYSNEPAGYALVSFIR